MNTSDKREQLRPLILSAAESYEKNLQGKVFLYVSGKDFFLLAFDTRNFLHLTGVSTTLKSGQFYSFALKHKLTVKQIQLKNHTFKEAKNKLDHLSDLYKLTITDVDIIRDLVTRSCKFRIALTDCTITVGLNRNENSDIYFPQSLRINDKIADNSTARESVDFIFCRDVLSKDPLFTNILFRKPDVKFPEEISAMLSEKLIDLLV